MAMASITISGRMRTIWAAATTSTIAQMKPVQNQVQPFRFTTFRLRMSSDVFQGHTIQENTRRIPISESTIVSS